MFKQIALKVYKPIYSTFISIRRVFLELKWKSFGYFHRYPISKEFLRSLPTDKKYLILAPHSDDEWIGCSQILLTCPQSAVCYMDMPGGDTPAIHDERLEEIKQSVGNVGRLLFVVSDNKKQALAEIIKKQNPDFILVPFFYDWHSEHICVMHILRDALISANYECDVLMYQVSVPLPYNSCNVCAPMDKKEQQNKWQIFSDIYKTQSFMPVNRFKCYERNMGGIVAAYSAEVYSMMTSARWNEVINKMILDDSERQSLREKLNNPHYVLERMNYLYNEKF